MYLKTHEVEAMHPNQQKHGNTLNMIRDSNKLIILIEPIKKKTENKKLTGSEI